MIHLAYGILNWDKSERVTNRYGSFFLSDQPFSEGPPQVLARPWHDTEQVAALQGKKVRLWCCCLDVRDSEHCGDMFLKVYPTRPQVGEQIDLGIGIFSSESFKEETELRFRLAPEDGRRDLWIDPRALYRLHAQTVDLWAEETTEACSPAPDLKCDRPGRIAVEGGVQAKQISEAEMLKGVRPSVERLGDGMFVVRPPRPGERLP